MVHVINATSVGHALVQGIQWLRGDGVLERTRNGDAYVSPVPVVTVQSHPWRCVLFSPARDANPFFHMVEAAWMLAGRNRVEDLVPYVSRFRNYADGDVVHGAYGHRWRHAFGFDQIEHVVDMLRRDPSTRQAVIQMWDASATHGIEENRHGVGMFPLPPSGGGGGVGGGDAIVIRDAGQDDLRGSWRDRPCNTHVYLRIRNGDILDMTVCCRSNDAIWGAHGANAVHFATLLSWLARRVGVMVGRLTQVSNNYHAYVSELDRITRRCPRGDLSLLWDRRYESHLVTTGVTPAATDAELDRYWQRASLFPHGSRPLEHAWSGIGCQWLRDVASATVAHAWYRQGRMGDAIHAVSAIHALDWRVACTEWLRRRSK